MEALEAAREFVSRYFPNCSVALLAGSVVRGDATTTSDLDILIFHESFSQIKKSVNEFGWLIQAIVLHIFSYQNDLELDASGGRPSLLTMCSEGVIIKDQEGLAKHIKDYAAKRLEEGPRLDVKKLDELRCKITDLLDDFISSDDFEEGMFIANELVKLTSNLLLRYNGKWTGEGKWLARSLQQYNKELSKIIVEALKDFICNETKEGLIKFVEDTLNVVGGRSYFGYSSSAEPGVTMFVPRID